MALSLANDVERLQQFCMADDEAVRKECATSTDHAVSDRDVFGHSYIDVAFLVGNSVQMKAQHLPGKRNDISEVASAIRERLTSINPIPLTIELSKEHRASARITHQGDSGTIPVQKRTKPLMSSAAACPTNSLVQCLFDETKFPVKMRADITHPL